MKKAVHHIGVYLVSWEALAVIIVLVFRYFWPEWLSKVFGLVGTDDLKFGHALLLLPAACIVPTYRMCDEILHPKEPGQKQVLNGWSGYSMLRARVFASLAFAVFGSAGWLAGVAAGMLGYIVTGPMVALAGLCVTLISTASVGWGRIRLRDALHGV